MSTARHPAPRATTPLAGEHHMSTGDSSPSSQTGVEESSVSNGGARERPVRKQLQKTTIDNSTHLADPSQKQESGAADSTTSQQEGDASVSNNVSKKPPKTKRSYEAIEDDDTERGKRKRSRSSGEASRHSQQGSDVNDELIKNESRAIDDPMEPALNSIERPGTPVQSDDNPAVDALAPLVSPQNKRRRQVAEDEGNKEPPKTIESQEGKRIQTNKDEVTTAAKQDTASAEVKGEGLESDPPDPPSSKPIEATKPSLSSGFSDTSAQPPFAALAGSKSPAKDTQTSSSAFSSSGFASFASVAQSPFAAVGSSGSKMGGYETNGSAFGSAIGTGGTGAKSAFASGSSSSPFANSGFASLGGTSSFKGFGASSGTSLKPFAPIGGAKPVKGFGQSSKSDDENDTSDDEGGAEEAQSFEPDETDERFYEQDVETGEEGEETVFSQRAKLFVMIDKQWKERGTGSMKVNIKRSLSAEFEGHDDKTLPKTTARFLLRADGSHRVALNTPITGLTHLQDPSMGGRAPTAKLLVFLGFENGKPLNMSMRLKSNGDAQKLYEVIQDLLPDLPTS
ncbi:MAG: hypothetical protein M1828_006761 [Chrysothrix sp. TS-e1954]|nr:MAG: hypothetical protein M1828_006761 [Chrysothrix sp. TS-e1954]